MTWAAWPPVVLHAVSPSVSWALTPQTWLPPPPAQRPSLRNIPSSPPASPQAPGMTLLWWAHGGAGCRAHPGIPGRPGSLCGISADPRALWAAHKRALYLNLTSFVSAPHMNIYRVASTANAPAPHSRNSSTSPLSDLTWDRGRGRDECVAFSESPGLLGTMLNGLLFLYFWVTQNLGRVERW